jgi:uncharacterized protein (DUF2267 family)
MRTNGVAAFDRSMQKTRIWLNEIMEALHVDRETAYSALRATLHVLRDRLPVATAAHLGAQLPLLVRGIYYEGYKPAVTPVKDRTQSDFLERLGWELRPHQLETLDVARAVFKVMNAHVTEGGVRHVRDILPKQLRGLWPERAPS